MKNLYPLFNNSLHAFLLILGIFLDAAYSENIKLRIISLSPSSTEIFFELGIGDQLIAVDSFSTFPEKAPRTRLSAYEPNIEAIASYEPDLVVLNYDVGNLVTALSRIGIETLHLPTPTSFEEILEQILKLGQISGSSKQAEELVNLMETRLKRISSHKRNKKHFKVYHEIDENYYSPSRYSFIGDLYEKLGFENIANSADEQGSGYPRLSPEFIVSSNPELIILPGKDWKSAEKLKSRPGWEEMTAIKKNMIFIVNPDIASRWGPRILSFAEKLVTFLDHK